METEIAESEQKLSNINNPIPNFEKSAKNTIRFFRNTLNMWTNGDLTIKRQIQKIMFPDGLVYSKEKQQYLTFEKNNLLHLISILSSNYSNKKADFSIVKLNKSAQVPGVGIEPTHLTIHDFESCASTSSAIRAFINGIQT